MPNRYILAGSFSLIGLSAIALLASCAVPAGGDSVVRIQGTIADLVGTEQCELSLSEVGSGNNIGTIDVGPGDFTRSIVFGSARVINDPVEFTIDCSEEKRQIIRSGLSINELTDWRYQTNLGVISAAYGRSGSDRSDPNNNNTGTKKKPGTHTVPIAERF